MTGEVVENTGESGFGEAELAICVPATLLCVRFIEAQLYEVKGMDAGVLAGSILTLVLAADV